ncbi:uncharacterized protein F5147DRAFT_409460 [Suillus discolor]|uniref:C2H2-type domain-containing protein n=1 Tax=Suillus discolor TaxID=1912936 RepID=A0A9P7FFH7_9AGAM|nr:uncharacterized protein F5147DRAFT_409460 [Suillus discolor]KAG2115073.1 hypothetical protein F5147DRAFT_409460 [Suillus discolor]
MRNELLTIPAIPFHREPSCSIVFSYSTGGAEPPLNKSDETGQTLNYANFEIATALMSPAHFRRIIIAPVHGRTCNTSYARCDRSAEPHSRKASQVAREQALADPSTPRSLHPIARQVISRPSAHPTFHLMDIPAGVSTLLPRDRCGWSQATDLCNDIVSANTLVVHMRKHVGGFSHRRIYCSWNGCGKLMRRDCLVRHIREIHLRSKRRAHD